MKRNTKSLLHQERLIITIQLLILSLLSFNHLVVLATIQTTVIRAVLEEVILEEEEEKVVT